MSRSELLLKSIYRPLLAGLLLLPLGARAQVTLAQETFEQASSDFGYASNTAAYLNLTDAQLGPPYVAQQYFFRQAFTGSGTYAGTTQALSSRQGSHTWTAENVRSDDQTNMRPSGYVVLNPIPNSQDYRNFVIRVAMAAPRGGTFTGPGSNTAFATDRVRLQYSFGGGAWTTAAMLMGNNSRGANVGADFQQLAALSDSTAVGNGSAMTGGGTILDQTYRDIVATLPATALGTNLRVRVVLSTRVVELAFDNIRVTGELDPTPKPTLSGIEQTAASYTEGGSPVPLTSSLTVGYSDNSATTIQGGSVRIGGFVAGQDVLSFSTQGPISGSFDGTAGVLTLSGTASQTAYQAALRSITYSNSNTTTATGGTRTLTFQVYNGTRYSTTASRNLTVTAVLNAPAALPYTEAFATDGEGTRYAGSPFVNLAVRSGFFRATASPAVSGSTAIGTATFTGWSGGYWFGEGTEDANNPNSPRAVLQLAPVDASNRLNLRFTLALGAAGSWRGYFDAANPADGFELYYRLNGGTPVKFGAFYCTGNGQPARQDADLNPLTPAAGTQLSPTLQDFTFDLPAAAAVGNLDFQLVQLSQPTAELAFDNIRITGIGAPTVSTAAPTAVTGSGAAVGGTVGSDGGSSITGRGVVFSATNATPTLGGSGVTQDAHPTNATGAFSETIGGLTAGTTYYLQAYATNAAGTSYGGVLSFTTQTTVASLVRAGSNPTNAGSVTYTLTFGASVTGGAVSNFSVAAPGLSGASVTGVTGSGATRTVTVSTGTGSGSLTLSLANATGLSPGVSTTLPFVGETYTIDRTAPVPTVSSGAGTSGGSTATTPIPFSVTFSEPVTGFAAGDVTVTNGAVASGSFAASSSTTYTFSVTPTTAGTPTTVAVGAGAATDAAGNASAATAAPYALTFTGLTVTGVTGRTPSPTATATVSYRVTFSGSLTGLSPGNFSLTLTGGVSGASVASVSGAGASYVVTVNTGTGDGTLRLNVATGTGTQPGLLSAGLPTTTGTVYTLVRNNVFGPTPLLTLLGSGSGAGSPDVTAFVDQVEVLSGGTPVAGAVPNAGFETSNVGPRGYLYGPSSVVAAPWAFNSGSGVARYLSAFGSPLPPEGDAVAFLQNAGSALAQPLTLTTGRYQVRLQASQRACCNGSSYDQELYVLVGGVCLATVQPSIAGFAAVTSLAFNVRAASRTAGQLLRLAGGSTPGYADFGADLTNPAPLLGAAYTQTAWIKPAIGTSSVTYYVLGNGTAATTAAPYLAVSGNGRLEAGFGSAGGLQSKQTGPQAVPADAWSHVAATYDGATLRLYLNGVEQTTLATTATPASTRVRYVGGVGPTGTSFFPGDIDEVTQWTRALTTAELRRLRHLTLSGLETGLASYLQFNDAGPTVADLVTGTVGTLTGATRPGSTAPVGYGTSALAPVTGAGSYAFAGTNAAISFSTAGTPPYDVVVSRLDGPPLGTQPSAAGLRHTYTPAYWIVDRYSSSAFAATITYTLSPTDLSPADAAAFAATLRLFKRGSNDDGAFAEVIPASAADAAAGTVSFPVSSFSQTVIGTLGSSPLPVTLTAFTATRVGPAARLRWTTSQELNCAYFAVERSPDGVSFREIGRVAGGGTTTHASLYQFTDAHLLEHARPLVYYRLRQVDHDGTTAYSPIRSLTADAPATLALFPNPTTGAATLTGAPAHARVQVLDALGRVVVTVVTDAAGTAALRLPASLPRGVYVVRVGAEVLRLGVE